MTGRLDPVLGIRPLSGPSALTKYDSASAETNTKLALPGTGTVLLSRISSYDPKFEAVEPSITVTAVDPYTMHRSA